MAEEDGFLSSVPYIAEFFGNKQFNTIWRMPSVILSDYLESSLDGSEPWPEEIVMLQPYQIGQILLYENANCLAVQTYFKMVGVELSVEYWTNTEFMTPTGKVPIVRCGSFLLTDLDRIASTLRERSRTSNEELPDNDKADMRAYMALVNNVLLNAELYICWIYDIVYETITSKRYGSVYPWPLNHVLTWRKRRQVAERLSVLDWKKKTVDEVYESVKHCLKTLSDLLGDGSWFIGSRPTELDALVFGHLFTILTTTLPDSRLADSVSNFPNLLNFCKKVEEEFFEKTSK